MTCKQFRQIVVRMLLVINSCGKFTRRKESSLVVVHLTQTMRTIFTVCGQHGIIDQILQKYDRYCSTVMWRGSWWMTMHFGFRRRIASSRTASNPAVLFLPLKMQNLCIFQTKCACRLFIRQTNLRFFEFRALCSWIRWFRFAFVKKLQNVKIFTNISKFVCGVVVSRENSIFRGTENRTNFLHFIHATRWKACEQTPQAQWQKIVSFVRDDLRVQETVGSIWVWFSVNLCCKLAWACSFLHNWVWVSVLSPPSKLGRA